MIPGNHSEVRVSFQDMLGGAEGTDKDESAKSLSTKCGYAAAALTLLPIPFTEVAVLSVHVGMVVGIGQIYGQPMTKGSATQFILRIGSTVGLSYVGKELAITAARALIPFVGSALAGLAAAPFRYATTVGLGAVARTYFKNQGEISDEDIRSIYSSSVDVAKKEFDPSKAKSQDAKDLAQAAIKAGKESEAAAEQPASNSAPSEASDDPVARLERLKTLLDKDLIDQAEYDSVKKRVLDSI
jgi:uncharacterized protein (DUF697 family)